jgi:hypothetical protein
LLLAGAAGIRLCKRLIAKRSISRKTLVDIHNRTPAACSLLMHGTSVGRRIPLAFSAAARSRRDIGLPLLSNSMEVSAQACLQQCVRRKIMQLADCASASG